ncbi:MAG TPA: FtsK/SpoIIIE domain-containing protein [Verrucomicrobiales bacterium]|nr:FtsK/SpoIIIE domain-containing protein [Verrucomicrobiales bacterium]
MTVNNEPEPRISRSLELLENLRRTAAAFAMREDELTKDLIKKRYTSERKHANGIKDDAAWLTRVTAEAETAWRKLDERTRLRYDSRAQWVEKADRSLKRELPKRVQVARGEWLGGLQRQKQKLEKEVASEISAADQTLAQTKAKLDAQKGQLDSLTKRARSLLRGSLPLLGKLKTSGKAADDASLDDVDRKLQTAQEKLDSLRGPLPLLSSLLPAWIAVPAILLVGAILIWGVNTDMTLVGGICGGLLVLVLGIHFAATPGMKPAAEELAAALGSARALHNSIGVSAGMEHAAARERAQERQIKGTEDIKGKWNQVGNVESEFVTAAREKLTAKVARVAEKITRAKEQRRTLFERQYQEQVKALQEQSEGRKEQYAALLQHEMAVFDTEEAERWAALQAEWHTKTTHVWHELSAVMASASRNSVPWDAAFVENWKPAIVFDPLAAFAELEVDLVKHAGALPKEPRLALPCPPQFSVPLALTFPAEGSLLFETREAGSVAAAGSLTHIVLRLLATTPPGRLAFTIFDPVGLGAGFAGLMHLADYEDAIINRRIWTQRDHMEERLVELSSHIEKVIQMYLRNDYETITKYNAQAGSVAEKYHFIVVSDFPSGFTEIAVKRLLSIATSGPRCGVFTLIHWDQRLPQPDGFVAEELRRNSIRLTREKDQFVLAAGPHGDGLALKLDEPPDSALALELVHRIGKASIDSSRVQVPFSQIAPAKDELWTNETTNELRIAIGRTGATKHQFLAIGKGTRQHALFAGKTGSGKSTLFHVIITNLSLACSPQQVEFYLIDFKKGVEFKCYATQRLPHARVVAIESDREFALSVLQRVDEELKRRGDTFRKLGVQDVAGFKRAGGGDLPRTLLIIDEFQEFFVEDDSIAQSASLLFDRIVRQGRAFGIHVLLGSQTLGGAYSLARATLGQMAIRVALQCNEADAYLIMDDGNSAPRLLSRPGEGIYNDASGMLEGNSPFQVVWLPDDERDEWLHKISGLARDRNDPHGAPIVFEGNAPADVTENDLLAKVRRSSPAASPPAGRAWLGAPNSIKGPTEATFYRQSGNHLLIVGQRDEAALTMLALSAHALAAEYPAGAAKFYFIHSAPPGTPDAEFIAMIGAAMPHGFTEVHTQELPAVIDELATEMKARSSGEIQADKAPAIYVFIHGLHRFKKLRQEDDFRFGSSDGPADTGSQFTDLISEGSALGIHLILTVDTYNNVNRSMNRKALSEFEMRIVFQMSANDSSSLIDSPAASTLGLHRAIFYNEQAGTLETFRPYAPPAETWWKS